jgi:hypothetical protein
MSRLCDQVDAFVDGELPAAEAEAFRAHLGSCASCQRELHELLMLAATLAQGAGAPSAKHPAGAPVVPLARRRRRRLLISATLAGTLAAAAAVVLWLRASERRPIMLARAPTRAIEARLAWAGADRWRPYDVQRGGTGGREDVPLGALSALERRGDLHGVAVGHLLAGEWARAERELARVPPGPDADADRALCAWQAGQAEAALGLLGEVLRARPAHPQALWNRALILGELGLRTTAAATFDQVAALGEPGWVDEARNRARALREREDAHQRAWQEASQAGKALVQTGLPPADTAVRAFPSFLRHYVYHAVRAAPTRERLLALLPLARAVDASAGETRLAAYLEQTAARRDLDRRAPLADTYRQLVHDPTGLSAADAERYLAALRQAHEDDLLLGALLLLHREASATDEIVRLAARRGDPWFVAIAEGALAARERASGNEAAAAERLERAVRTCRAQHVDYRCTFLEFDLAELEKILHRTANAQQMALAGLARARSSAVVAEDQLLFLVGEIARFRNGFALAEAYLDEAVRRHPERCTGRRYAHEILAYERMVRLDPAGARRELDQAPRCGEPITLARADALANLERLGRAGPEAQALVADLDAARPGFSPGEQAFADAIAGRYLLEHDRAAGVARLERAIARAGQRPESDADARKARTYALVTLAVDDARRGQSASALTRIAAYLDGVPPPRCALGVAVDDERIVAVASGPAGDLATYVTVDRKSPELDPARLVPPELSRPLAGCPDIAVYAPPPIHGLPRLLPSELAWSYRMGRPAVPAAPPPAAPAPTPRRLIVSDVEPPPALDLPRLSPFAGRAADAVWLFGPTATPGRVLGELATATEVEVHAHGLVDLGRSDASMLVLSPDPDGRYALSAGEIRRLHLGGHPVVILGACRAAQVAPWLHQPWSLPMAFVEAGARAVVASPAPIQDAQAGPFFQAVLERIRRGQPPAAALRDERQRVHPAGAARAPDGTWMDDLLVFE